MRKFVFTLIAVTLSLRAYTQAPANDEPCGATTLTVTESSDNCIATASNINVNNITYANLVRPTSCNPATNTNPDMWFKFTPPSNTNGYKTSFYFNTPYWFSGNLAYIEVYYVSACNGTYSLVDCWAIDFTYSQGSTPRVVSTSPGQQYYIRFTRGALDPSNPTVKLCLTTGRPPLTSKIGINTNTPATNFDVAGTVTLRDELGIGTSSPQAKLHVTGNGIFQDGINVGGGANNTYSGANINRYSMNLFADQASSGDKFVIDRRYNGLKYGMGFYDAPGIYGSNILFYAPFSQDNYIWGRGDPFYSNGAYFTEWMRLKNDGNLGIGTNAPDTKLHVVGSIKMVDGNQAASKVLTSDANGVGSWQTISQYWTASGTNISNSNSGTVSINNGLSVTNGLNVSNGVLITGNVGIGTNTPGFPLNFGNILGDKISLWGNSGSHYGFGVQSGLLQIHSNVSTDDIGFGYGSSASFTERVRIKGNGNVGIGITNPSNPLSFPASLSKKISLYPGATGDVGLSVAGNDLRIYADNVNARVSFGFDDYTNGFTSRAYVLASGTTAMVIQGNLIVNSTTYTSDARYKTQIQTLTNALPNLLQLRGTSYFFNTKAFPQRNFSTAQQLGLIAQEVEKIYPALVSTDADGYKSVNYTGLVPVLIEAIKDQQKQIEELKRLVMEKLDVR